MSAITQVNFSGGELTPELHGNTGLEQYRKGAKTLKNCVVRKIGGFYNRSGTEFIAEVNDSAKTIKFIPFIFSDTQTYVLEFGDQYMRVHKNGVQLKNASQNITAITNANPCVVTYGGADNYANGDQVYISGVVGAIGNYVNGRWFVVAGVNTGANTFQLNYLGGTAVNSTSWGAYSSAGTIEEVYRITTPYLEADLSTLQFSQSADVISIAHQSYAPRELSRSADTSWTLSQITFDSDTGKPTAITQSGTAYASASASVYKVTAVDAITGEESTPGFWGTGRTITGITQANPGVVTSNAHGFVNSEIFLTGILGMTELNARRFIAASTGANTFQLRDDYGGGGYLNTTSLTAYLSGGTAYIVGGFDGTLQRAASTTPITISWTKPSSNISYFKIYKSDNVQYGTFAFGLIGTSNGISFSDTGLTPDFTEQPPEVRNPFYGSSNYPKTVTHAQQRIYYGNTTNNPETVWGSKTGCYHNFITRSSISDDDPVTFTLANRRVNQVQHLIDLEKLIALLSGSEVILNGNDAGFITPTSVNAKTPTYNGSASLRPIIADKSLVYLQSRQVIVRDMKVDTLQSTGDDLTVAAKHLFEGHTIVDWDYQENPDSVVWIVRDDGLVISMTYVPTMGVIACCQHDFGGGLVENVCVVPEGSEDAVYFCVNRTINGGTKRYIERLSNRFIDDIKDNKFMDSFLSYDGRNTGATTMTLSGGTDWLYSETLTLTASASTFASTDVGNEIHFFDAEGVMLGRFEIKGYTGVTVVTGKFDRTVPAAVRTTATTYWAMAVDQVTGLWHLEGEEVSVLGDYTVVGSPYNTTLDTTYTVANGALSFSECYSVIHVGLPYLSDFESLDIDSPSMPTLQKKKILITEVTAKVYKTAGLWFGGEPPSDDTVDATENLTELKLHDDETYDSPTPLTTSTVDCVIQTKWAEGGRVFIRQIDPLPMSILSVTPSGIIPGGN